MMRNKRDEGIFMDKKNKILKLDDVTIMVI